MMASGRSADVPASFPPSPLIAPGAPPQASAVVPIHDRAALAVQPHKDADLIALEGQFRTSGSAVLVNVVHQVLQARDGGKAFVLARVLDICELSETLLSESYVAMSDPQLKALPEDSRRAGVQGAEQFRGQCQTVGGDLHRLQRELLDLATAQGVLGAAAEQYMLRRFKQGDSPRDPELFAQIISEGRRGDARAASLVAASRLVPADTHDREVLCRALDLAARDPANAEWMRQRLGRRHGVTLPAEAFTQAENAMMDAEARAVAAALKQHELALLNRYRRPGA
jgi:hypothetical protein